MMMASLHQQANHCRKVADPRASCPPAPLDRIGDELRDTIDAHFRTPHITEDRPTQSWPLLHVGERTPNDPEQPPSGSWSRGRDSP